MEPTKGQDWEKGIAQITSSTSKCYKDWKEVPALSGGQDPAMAGRSHGTQNIVQRLWCPVQVGAAGAGVPPRVQSDFFEPVAFEFSPEGDGDEEAEGDGRRGDDRGEWSMLI